MKIWKDYTYPIKCDGKYTFHGVVNEYWEKISIRWRSPNYLARMQRCFELHILPSFDDRKPIELLTLQDCNSVIDLINSRNREKFLRDYADIETIKRAIRYVFIVAFDERICLNYPLAFSDFGRYEKLEIEITKDTMKIVNCRIDYKSFTPHQEEKLFEFFQNLDPKGPKEYWGLLLMLCCGLRGIEACGLRYSDIYLMYGFYFFKIYESHHWNPETKQLELNYDLKTENAYRYAFLPRFAFNKLMERKKYLSEINSDYGSQDSVEKKLIVSDVITQEKCDPSALNNAAKKVLADIGVTKKDLQELEMSIRQDLEFDEESIKVWGIRAYTLRHHFMMICEKKGLTEAEVNYIVGHKMPEDVSRNEFAYMPNSLKKIGLKLSKFDYFDEPPLQGEQLHLNTSYFIDSLESNQTNEAAEDMKVIVRLTQKEPGDQLFIKTKEERLLKGSCRPFKSEKENNDKVDMSSYNNRFWKQLRKEHYKHYED